MVTCAADMEAGQMAAEGGALAVAAPASTGLRAGGGREPEGLPCPRCESTDTKFCYYNNYNLSQPRHFCRACRRYWTRGGALRNVPVGGGTRKATATISGRRKQRAAGATAPAPPASAALALAPAPALLPPLTHAALLRQYGLPFPEPAMPSPLAAVDPDRRLLDLGGSFSSLIAAAAPAPDVAAHFSAGFFVGGLAPGLALAPSPPPPPAAALPPPPPPQQHQQQVSQALPEGLIWSMGWPDLSI